MDSTSGNRLMQWLKDGRILYSSQGMLFLVDPRTRQSRQLLKVPPPDTLSGPQFSADGRMLYFLRGSAEADIWMVELK